MNLKAIFLIFIIIVTGLFIFLKLELLGSPTSDFNKTTRIDLGKYPAVRFILGMKDYGDARKEYLTASGPIKIIWFKPQLEDVDGVVLEKFATLVRKYTEREVEVSFGGNIDDVTVDKKSGLSANKFFEVSPKYSTLYVFFTEDYKPRNEGELSSTLGSDGMVVSLKSHREFLQAYEEKLDEYLVSSMLHEFGHQLGMGHINDPTCIMNAHAGEGEDAVQSFNFYNPQDFCQAEQDTISDLKLKLQN